MASPGTMNAAFAQGIALFLLLVALGAARAQWTDVDGTTFYDILRDGAPAERRRVLQQFQGPTSPPLTVAVSICDYSWIEFCENMAFHHHRQLPDTPLLMHVMDRRVMHWCTTRLARHMRVACVFPPESTGPKKNRGCRCNAWHGGRAGGTTPGTC